MHGMINRAFQEFIEVRYGHPIWEEVCSQANLPFTEFEAMLQYNDAYTIRCFEATTRVLHLETNALLEDLGTHLITHKPLEPLRRLLRFGGGTFCEFVLSLEELEERGRLVAPDLEIPSVGVTQYDTTGFLVASKWKLPGSGPVLLGALRAMADDYGALVTLSLAGIDGETEKLDVTIHDVDHSEGRTFDLALRHG